MPDLSEYLGHLLCEITRARVMADHEAVRIAHTYAADESGLLRHFPVPRMRLPTLEINVPVVVSEIPDGYVEVTTADPRSVAKLLVESLGPLLAAQAIKIDTTAVTRLILADPFLAQGRLSPDLAYTLSARVTDQIRASEEAAARDAKAADPAKTAERFRSIAALVREQLATTLQALPRRPAGIGINAKTAAVKEIGNTAMVLNLKMVITEESMEIVVAQEPDSTSGDPPPPRPTTTKPRISRLIPE